MRYFVVNQTYASSTKFSDAEFVFCKNVHRQLLYREKISDFFPYRLSTSSQLLL